MYISYVVLKTIVSYNSVKNGLIYFICLYVHVILYIKTEVNYECLIERKSFGNYHIMYALYELHFNTLYIFRCS